MFHLLSSTLSMASVAVSYFPYVLNTVELELLNEVTNIVFYNFCLLVGVALLVTTRVGLNPTLRVQSFPTEILFQFNHD
jgi:hypothetical protein